LRSLVPALLAFAVLVAAHVILWRLRRPRGQYAALAGLALTTPAVLLAAGLSAPARGAWLPAGPSETVSSMILYGALVLAYVTTYSAVQADSPTMTILLRIEQTGPAGLTRDELVNDIDDRVLILPRLEDLVAGRLVARADGRYVIGPRGVAMVRPHMFFRRLLGMEKGG